MSRSDEGTPIREPWQAQALATAISLQDVGLFTATEWSNALGAAIRRGEAAGDPDEGEAYYHHVLDALETLLREKGLIEAGELLERKTAWEEAYRRTPHGQPVTLAEK